MYIIATYFCPCPEYHKQGSIERCDVSVKISYLHTSNITTNTYTTIPIINGTHAPCGTFFNEAPQKILSKVPKTIKKATARTLCFSVTCIIAKSTVVEMKTVATANLLNEKYIYQASQLPGEEKFHSHLPKSVGQCTSIFESGDHSNTCEHHYIVKK